MNTYEEHFEQACKLRDEYWKSVGVPDPDVLAHAINPSFMGGPRWPSLRQAFATIRKPERTIIATDGLSDPYDDMETNTDNAPYNGFGLEVYVAADPIEGQVSSTWEFQLLYQAALLIADHGNIVGLLDEMTYITSEFYNVDAPEEFVNAEGRVGVIMGLPDDTMPGTLDLTLEPVKIVNVKLLTLAELEHVTKNGAAGRMQLAELLLKQGNATLSTLNRPSVI